MGKNQEKHAKTHWARLRLNQFEKYYQRKETCLGRTLCCVRTLKRTPPHFTEEGVVICPRSHNQLGAEPGSESGSICLQNCLPSFILPAKRHTANIYQGLCVSFNSKCFIWITWFNPSKNPLKWVYCSPLLRRGDRSTERPPSSLHSCSGPACASGVSQEVWL